MIDRLTQADAIERVLSAHANEGAAPSFRESLIECAKGLIEQGESVRALGLLEDSLSQAQLPLDEWAVRNRALQARALFNCDRNRECLEISRQLLSETSGEFAATHVSLMRLIRIVEGAALWRLNRVAESVEQLGSLRMELLTQPDSSLLAMCTLNLSTALLLGGDRAEAFEMALDALVTARRRGDEYWAGLSQLNICFVERQLCRWESAADAARGAVEVFEALGNLHQLNHARRSLALVLWKRGRLTEALEVSERAIEGSASTRNDVQKAYSLQLKALILMHRGEIREASEALAQCPDLSEPCEHSRAALLKKEFEGDCSMEVGDVSAALAAFEALYPRAAALVPRGDIVAELRRRRAECYLLLGDPARAHAGALEAITHTRELGDRYEEAATYRIAALAAAALGRPDEAKKHFTQGFAYYDDIETPYEWGKLWMSYGDWLCGEQSAHYRDLSGAHEAYRAAEQHFEQMGAEHKLTEARARIAKLAELMKAEGEALSESALKARPRRRPRADRELQQRAQWAFETFGLVTRHRPLLDMLEQVSRVAASDLPVLVLGESGTGKELVARGVHFVSGRTGRFVEVNCSAVPASIMESEFFGSSHGSYTGSTRDRTGLLEDAHLGSFFLDEIGEMSLDLQSKLLRFLETGRVRRIGETDGRQVDVRLIAATNRAHDKLKTGSGFREDLYYRLAHAVIEMPPLRERGDDVELLLDHFLDKFCDEARKPVALSPAAREKLLACTWPGNVRQLRALIHRFVLQSPAGHVVSPREIPADDAAAAPRNFLEEMEGQEKRRIQEALERAHFVKADAARFLRMSRTTLIGKMKRYGITA